MITRRHFLASSVTGFSRTRSRMTRRAAAGRGSIHHANTITAEPKVEKKTNPRPYWECGNAGIQHAGTPVH